MTEYKTLKEASEILRKSEKTISRYIQRGLLHPEKIKSAQGTLEYRFLTEELEQLKSRTEQIGQETGQDRIIINILSTQLTQKDRQINILSGQIGQLIERVKEANYLLKGLQDRVLQLEAPKRKARTPGERIRLIILLILFLLSIGLYFYFNPLR